MERDVNNDENIKNDEIEDIYEIQDTNQLTKEMIDNMLNQTEKIEAEMNEETLKNILKNVAQKKKNKPYVARKISKRSRKICRF